MRDGDLERSPTGTPERMAARSRSLTSAIVVWCAGARSLAIGVYITSVIVITGGNAVPLSRANIHRQSVRRCAPAEMSNDEDVESRNSGNNNCSRSGGRSRRSRGSVT